MDDLLEPFVEECRELSAQAARDLQALAADPADALSLDAAFRAFHTLKGSGAIVGFGPFERLTHAAEDVLGAVRAGRRTFGRAEFAALTAVLDQIDGWLDAIDARGGLPDEAAPEGRFLEQALEGLGEDVSAPVDRADRAPVRPLEEPPAGARTWFLYEPDEACFFRGEDPLALARGVPKLLSLYVRPSRPWPVPADFDPFRCISIFEGFSGADPAAVAEALNLAGDQARVGLLDEIVKAPDGESAALAGTRTLRVEASRLDAVSAALDELMVARNDLWSRLGEAEATDRRGADARARVDRLLAELYAGVNRLRMAPLSRLFGRFPRLVREMSAELGKSVELVIEGEAVEADKAVADALYEPLLHLVRNALDHGLEIEAERVAAGKAPKGRLRLSARATGGEVVVEVSDDGRGLDPMVLRRVATERGVLDAEAAAGLSDAAALDLVFAPGFSTSARVGRLSGRGVGMDAVRAAVAALGGRATLDGERGRGASVTLRLPASVVLERVLTVHTGDHRFGVRLDAVVETARVPAARIVPVRAGSAFVLREHVVPLVDLRDLLGLPAPTGGCERRVLVARSGEDLVGVAVDAFGERFDAPLRPTTGMLAGLPGVAGTTLSRDGSVLLVLDLPELIG